MPKITLNPHLISSLDIANKKFIPELPQTVTISGSKIKNIRPVTDLDDRIITYSGATGRLNRTSSDEFLRETTDLMSFEKTKLREADGLRTYELDTGNPYREKAYVFSKYDYDDVPLAQDLVNKERHTLGRSEINHYFSTSEFDFNDEIRLKLLYFKYDLIPAVFRDNRITNLNDDGFANSAVKAWINGVSDNTIAQCLEKCVIKEDTGSVPKANKGLFEFLIKNPNKRKLAIIERKNKTEYFDENFAHYYNVFKDKYFDSEATALKILEDCRTPNEKLINAVDLDLCELVRAIRRRTAHGLPERQIQETNGIFTENKYCDRDFPWSETDSKLLKIIKNCEPEFRDEVIKDAKKFLVEDKLTVKEVLPQIEETIKNKPVIEKEDITEQAPITDIRLVRFIRPEYNQKIYDECFDYMEKLGAQYYHAMMGADMVSRLQTLFGNNMEIYKKLIDMCIYPTMMSGENQRVSSAFLRIIEETYSKLKSFDLANSIYKEHLMNTTNTIEKMNTYKALNEIIRYNKDKSIFRQINIVKSNIESVVEYHRRFDILYGKAPKHLRQLFKGVKLVDFKYGITKRGFDPQNSKMLRMLEQFSKGEISEKELKSAYQNFLNKHNLTHEEVMSQNFT